MWANNEGSAPGWGQFCANSTLLESARARFWQLGYVREEREMSRRKVMGDCTCVIQLRNAVSGITKSMYSSSSVADVPSTSTFQSVRGTVLLGRRLRELAWNM